MEMSNARRILTADEAAAMLKMSRWSIYQMVRRREIPAHQKMKRAKLYFFEDELQAFVEGLRITPQDDINRIANNI